MFHLEDHALARREPLQRAGDLLAEFLAEQMPFRIALRPLFGLAIEEIARAAFGSSGTGA